MKVELNYKECCIIKHALLKSIKQREKNIADGSFTGRDEKLELESDISCYRKIKILLDILRLNNN